MSGRLFLSFWDLCLDNLPPGRFERRVITAVDAGAMIQAAPAPPIRCCASAKTICLRRTGQESGGATKN